MILNNAENILIGNQQAEKVYLGTVPIWENLPPEYRKIEYLESSGTQYIDTGWLYDVGDSGNENINFNIQCKCSCSDNYSVFGNRECFNLKGNNGAMWFRGYAYYSSYNLQTDVPTGTTPVKWQYNNTILTANGVEKGTLPRGSGSGSNRRIYLFARASGRDPENMGGTVRIYNFSVSSNRINSPNNVTQIVDLWPCIRKADNVPGMYDKVTKTFFTNAGTGDFIVPT